MKNKKTITAIVLLLVMCCISLFAADEKKEVKSAEPANTAVFTLTPALGLSAATAKSDVIDISIAQFDLGFHAAMLGIPKAAKDSHLNNLTLMVNIDLGVGGTPSVRGESGCEYTGTVVLFQMSALCGYTFKPVTNLYLTPAAGLGFSVSSVNGSQTCTGGSWSSEWSLKLKGSAFSLPIFFGLKYFFTDRVGIELTLIDTINFGTMHSWLSFSYTQNIFVLKVGPTFRLGMK